MMFPSAVQGHMPYVDEYKQQQIKKVIEQARSRHHSGPEKSSTHQTAKQRSTHSMPILWQSVYAGQKPRFISMPSSLNTPHHHLHHGQRSKQTASSSRSKSSSGNSFISSIKKLFSSRKSVPNVRDNSSGAIIESTSARPYTVPSKKPADTADSHLNQSPKRQRMRTISNISSVMETIEEEIQEIMASRDELHDSSSSCSDRDCDSIASAPELGAGNLYFNSFGDLSNASSASSHRGSNDILCAA